MVSTSASSDEESGASSSHLTTLQVAQRLGLAVRSVQMMVDRGDLQAWKTPGGHRRISRESLERWVASRQGSEPDGIAARPRNGVAARVLLIEDSVHYQKLVTLLMRQRFPDVELHIAADGVAGLATYGRLLPEILLVDILLPGIDGATLITSLRSDPAFAGSELVVVTSLDESQRAPYAFALEGVPVVHKTRLAVDLPPLLERSLSARRQASA